MTTDNRSDEMKQRHAAGETYQQIADDFGISRQRAHRIVSGKSQQAENRDKWYELALEAARKNNHLEPVVALRMFVNSRYNHGWAGRIWRMMDDQTQHEYTARLYRDLGRQP